MEIHTFIKINIKNIIVIKNHDMIDQEHQEQKISPLEKRHHHLFTGVNSKIIFHGVQSDNALPFESVSFNNKLYAK